MSITFTPALGETVHVSVPDTGTSTVQLYFTAVLTPWGLDEFSRNGVKVQVWSDIPAGGRSAGEWGELDFTGNNLITDDGDPKDTKFSLLPVDHNGDEEGQKNTLSLEFSVPLTGPRRFSFTYRLVYPSGEIRWLGQFGENGALVLERAASRLVLGEGWSPQATSGAYLWNTRGRTVEDFEVASLVNPSEYVVWALGKDSFGKPKNSSLIFFVPRIRSESVVLHQTFVLSASPDSTISLNSLGPITVSGGGSFLLQTYDPRSDLQIFMDSVLSHCSSAKCRLLGCDTDSGRVIISSPKNSYPVAAVIVPLSPSRSAKSQVRMELQTLAGLLPDASQLSVFSNVNLSIHFFMVPLEGAKDETISFAVHSTGSQFLLTPLYNLSGTAGEWQVAITTPYTPTGPPAELDSLPTPPPSPHLRPVAHLSTRSSDSFGPSVPTLSDVGLTSSQSPILTISERSSMSTLHPRFSQKRSLAYVKHVFAVVLIFFAMVFAPLFGPLFGHFQGPITTREPAVVDDERTPLLGDHQEPESEVETDALPPVTARSAGHVVALAPSSKRDTVPSSPASLFAELSGGQASIVLRPAEPSASADQIVFELNGQVVERIVSKIEDGVSFVEFNSGKGGRVKVYSGL